MRRPLGAVSLVLLVGLAGYGWFVQKSATVPSTEAATPPVELPTPSQLNAALSAPLPERKGGLTIRGIVTGPQGAVAGAMVIATSGTREAGDDVLSDLSCSCDKHRSDKSKGQSLLECGGPDSDRQWVEMVIERRGEAPPVARTQSLEDGSFVLEGLSPGQVSLWAEAPSLMAVAHGVNAGQTDVRLTLDGGHSLSGKLTLETNEKPGQEPSPEGALITAILVEQSRFFDVLTGPDGRFKFGPLPRGRYRLVGSKPGFLPDFTQIQSFETAAPVRLTLLRPRTLSGMVMRNEKPLPNVSVSVEGGHRKFNLQTDKAGKFAITHLGPATYQVNARHQHAGAQKTIQLSKKDIHLLLSLDALSVVRGQIQESSGRGIANAKVSVHVQSRNGGSSASTETNADGRFDLSCPGSGLATLRASAKGFVDGHQQLGIDPTRPSDKNLTLITAVKIRGVVVSDDGRPIADANVSVARQSGDAWSNNASSASTDPHGAFQMEDMGPGLYHLRVEAPGYLHHGSEFDAPNDSIRVVLDSGATVAGSVRDSMGAPLAKVALGLTDEQGLMPPRSPHAISDERGKFRIHGVKDGKYRVAGQWSSSKTSSQSRSFSVPVRVQSGHAPWVDIRFSPGQSLSGRLVDTQGHPVADANVQACCESADIGRSQASATTDERGEFNLTVSRGAVSLGAYKPGYGPVKERVTAHGGDEGILLVLQSATKVTGKVVDPNGTPVLQYSVNGRPVTDPDGEFDLAIERERELSITSPGFAPKTVAIQPVSGESLSLGAIVLDKGRTITGLVVDAVSGAPILGTLVDWRPVSALHQSWLRLPPYGVASTNAAGQFSLSVVPRENVAIVAQHLSYKQAKRILEGNEERIEIKLEQGAIIRGHVWGPKGGLAGIDVSTAEGGLRTTTTADGSYEFRGLEPGPARVMVHSGQGRWTSQQIVLGAEGRDDVDFHIGDTEAQLKIQFRADDGLLLPATTHTLLLEGDVPMPRVALDLRNQTGLQYAPNAGDPFKFSGLPPGVYTLFAFAQPPRNGSGLLPTHREVIRVDWTGERQLTIHFKPEGIPPSPIAQP